MTEFDEDARWLAVDRGPYRLACNFAAGEQAVPLRPSHGEVLLATAGGARLSAGTVLLPALCGALLR
jgi:hypothetical protein